MSTGPQPLGPLPALGRRRARQLSPRAPWAARRRGVAVQLGRPWTPGVLSLGLAALAVGCPGTTRHQVELDRVDIDLASPSAPGATAADAPAPAAALTAAAPPRTHLPRIDEVQAVREGLGSAEDFEALKLTVGGDDLVRVIVDARSKAVVYFSPRVYPTHAAFIAEYLRGKPDPYSATADGTWLGKLASQVQQPGAPLLLLDLVHTGAGVWALSFWEGARPGTEDVRVAYMAVAGSFFGGRDLLFRPLTGAQAAAAEPAKTRGVKIVANRGFYSAAKARVGHPGHVTGHVRLARGPAPRSLGRGDVAILHDPVLDLPPVAGAVRGAFTAPTSNAAVRAQVDGTPFGWLQGASDKGMMFLGHPVALDVDSSADPVVRLGQSGGRKGNAAPVGVGVYPVQRAVRDLRLVSYLDRPHAGGFGTAAANAGALAKRKLGGVRVARGFGVPLAFYLDRMEAGGLAARAKAALEAKEPAARDAAAQEVRRALGKGPLPPALEAQLKLRLQRLRLKPGESLRVLASVNADGLPWLGPPVRVDARGPNAMPALGRAVRLAWASLWTREAVAARAAARLKPLAVGAGVLVQVAPATTAAGLIRVGGRRGGRARVQAWAHRGAAAPPVPGSPPDEAVVFDRAAMRLWIARRLDQPRQPVYSQAGGLRFEPAAAHVEPILTPATVHALSTVGRNASAALPGPGVLGLCFEQDRRGLIVLAATRLAGR